MRALEPALAPAPGRRGEGAPAAFALLLVALGALAAFFLVRPALADYPYYRPRPVGTSYDYWPLVVAAFVPYALALAACRSGGRGRCPSVRTLLVAAGVLYAALIPAPAQQSQDIYQYLLFGEMSERGLNPYADLAAGLDHPWREYTHWDDLPSGYGPLWMLLAHGITLVSGQSLTAAFLLAKTAAAALAMLAALGLARVARTGGARGLRRDPRFAVLAFAFNPMVVVAVGVGGREDAAVAACLVGAVLTERRRPLVSTALVSAAALVKAYAGIVLVAWLIAVWKRRGAKTAALHAGASAAVAAVAFAPYRAGWRTLEGMVGLADFTSASLVGAVIRFATGNVGDALAGPELASRMIVAAATGVLLAAVLAVARSERTRQEPWRAGALLFAVYVLLTPWYLFWNLIGLVALAAAVADERLTAAVLTFSATSLVVVAVPLTTGSASADLALQTLLRYGPPLLVAFGPRASPYTRRRARSPAADAA